MTRSARDSKLEADLAACLASRFEGLEVAVGHNRRWNRPCVTFRWAGFDGLLPEERYHRLVSAIPAPFRESRMAGLVWLELAPEESVEAYLSLPRSEDIADRAADIYADLVTARLFERLAEAMAPSPSKSCRGDFSFVAQVSSDAKDSPQRLRDAKLLFIRHGVYCDCQILDTVLAELQRLYAGAA